MPADLIQHKREKHNAVLIVVIGASRLILAVVDFKGIANGKKRIP